MHMENDTDNKLSFAVVSTNGSFFAKPSVIKSARPSKRI